jgi:hypothetical protein
MSDNVGYRETPFERIVEVGWSGGTPEPPTHAVATGTYLDTGVFGNNNPGYSAIQISVDSIEEPLLQNGASIQIPNTGSFSMTVSVVLSNPSPPGADYNAEVGIDYYFGIVSPIAIGGTSASQARRNVDLVANRLGTLVRSNPIGAIPMKGAGVANI